ncbi:hypothetical protein [Ralstonia phage phiRSL1]|uniref:Uncharacterized protein n=1 Tax=Ralstonia phage phiRSL1 TaxID=1980924 RepID=B2ZY26_9CAUD|nr:hypothetical protein RSL1_ORF124 [Ralstonia phage phiRSL1]BAG41569.1 hypothetical protein [Ralstonia phage phiRSL1]
MAYDITAAVSRLAGTKCAVFADAHSEAGIALKEIAKILGPHFLKDERPGEQVIIWRTSQFKAELSLNLDDDVLDFTFKDKGATAGFSAEGYNARTLFQDIRHNITQYRPTKKVPTDVQMVRDKFEHLQ